MGFGITTTFINGVAFLFLMGKTKPINEKEQTCNGKYRKIIYARNSIRQGAKTKDEQDNTTIAEQILK